MVIHAGGDLRVKKADILMQGDYWIICMQKGFPLLYLTYAYFSARVLELIGEPAGK